MASGAEGASPGSNGRRHALIRFTRDIAINVIANLVAAAIIYLAGAAAGLLPRSPALIATSILLIVIALSCVLVVVAILWPSGGRFRLAIIAMYWACLGFIVVPLILPGSTWWINVTFSVTGGLMLARYIRMHFLLRRHALEEIQRLRAQRRARQRRAALKDLQRLRSRRRARRRG